MKPDVDNAVRMAIAKLLAELAGRLPKLGSFVDGGFPDIFRLTPSAAMIGPSKVFLGSAAVIGAHWALTASHCLLDNPRALKLATGSGAGAISVDTVYWQNGDVGRIDGSAEWPVGAGSLFDAEDEIVLLHLADKMPPFFGIGDSSGYADGPGSVLPQLDDYLLVAGYGEDDDGIFPDHAQVALMRYYGARPHWRWGGYRDRTLPLNGLARKCDSGAPIFLPDMSSLRVWRRLVGIHSCRTVVAADTRVPAGGEIADFLPVSASVQSWVRTITKLFPLPPPAAKPPSSSQPFTLRGQHYCMTLVHEKALDNKKALDGKLAAVWRLTGVASPHRLLAVCDEIEVDSASGTPQMLIKRGGVAIGPALNLTRDPSGHWLSAYDAARRATYYLFRRTDGNITDSGGAVIVNVRRFRIEAFLDGSNAPRPGPKNIHDGPPASPSDDVKEETDYCKGVTLAALGPGTNSEPDQDDQGNGYEKPR